MRRGLLARHPELTEHAQYLTRTGAWRRWQAIDDRLSTFASLGEAAHTWRTERSVPCYLVIAALARLGSRRGADDDDAAIAALVMLEVDIDLLAAKVSRNCESDDVVWAVWDAVKRAEPQLGCRAPYFLIRRAKKRLLTEFSKDRLEDPMSDRFAADDDEPVVLFGVQPPTVPGEADAGDPTQQLAHLLRWAAVVGVIAPSDADLLMDLTFEVSAQSTLEDTLRIAGARRGVCPRTMRRHRDVTVQRLRAALPDYLAAVS